MASEESLLACFLVKRERCLNWNATNLQADNVRTVVANFIQNPLAPVHPVQGPAGTVAVHLACGIFITQHVVTHYGEDARWFRSIRACQRYPWPLRWLISSN